MLLAPMGASRSGVDGGDARGVALGVPEADFTPEMFVCGALDTAELLAASGLTALTAGGRDADLAVAPGGLVTEGTILGAEGVAD
mmetsp:Transcript_2016/g.5763  ORF Transcript_2016/g.5763 Transcript_2016/m.5763 type:complete len:85 (+) Transcript_2016:597-851(+)